MFITFINSITTLSVKLIFSDNKDLSLDISESILSEDPLNTNCFDENFLLYEITHKYLHNQVENEELGSKYSIKFRIEPDLSLKIKLGIAKNIYKKMIRIREYNTISFTSQQIFDLISSQTYLICDNYLIIIRNIFFLFHENIIKFESIIFEFFTRFARLNIISVYNDRLHQMIENNNYNECIALNTELFSKIIENRNIDPLETKYLEWINKMSNLMKIYRTQFLLGIIDSTNTVIVYYGEKNLEKSCNIPIKHTFITNNHLFRIYKTPCLYILSNPVNETKLLIEQIALLNKTKNININITTFYINILNTKLSNPAKRSKNFDNMIEYLCIKNFILICNIGQMEIQIKKNNITGSIDIEEHKSVPDNCFDNFLYLNLGIMNFLPKNEKFDCIHQIANLCFRKYLDLNVTHIKQQYFDYSEFMLSLEIRSIELYAQEGSLKFNFEEFDHISNKLDKNSLIFDPIVKKENWIICCFKSHEIIIHNVKKINAIMTKNYTIFEVCHAVKKNFEAERDRYFLFDEQYYDINVNDCLLRQFRIELSDFDILCFHFLKIQSKNLKSMIMYQVEGESTRAFLTINNCNIEFFSVQPSDINYLVLIECNVGLSETFTQQENNENASRNDILFRRCSFTDNFQLIGFYNMINFFLCEKSCKMLAVPNNLSVRGIRKVRRSPKSSTFEFSNETKSYYTYNYLEKNARSSASLEIENVDQ